MYIPQQAWLQKKSKGDCRAAHPNEFIRGVYDNLNIPEGITGLSFNAVVLGDVTVNCRGAYGTIYRPSDVDDFAEVAQGNPNLQVIRRPWSELVKHAGQD